MSLERMVGADASRKYQFCLFEFFSGVISS